MAGSASVTVNQSLNCAMFQFPYPSNDDSDDDDGNDGSDAAAAGAGDDGLLHARVSDGKPFFSVLQEHKLRL